jgi:hypothetical protein
VRIIGVLFALADGRLPKAGHVPGGGVGAVG